MKARSDRLEVIIKVRGVMRCYGHSSRRLLKELDLVWWVSLEDDSKYTVHVNVPSRKQRLENACPWRLYRFTHLQILS